MVTLRRFADEQRQIHCNDRGCALAGRCLRSDEYASNWMRSGCAYGKCLHWNCIHPLHDTTKVTVPAAQDISGIGPVLYSVAANGTKTQVAFPSSYTVSGGVVSSPIPCNADSTPNPSGAYLNYSYRFNLYVGVIYTYRDTISNRL
jgi:hypothetical protein